MVGVATTVEDYSYQGFSDSQTMIWTKLEVGQYGDLKSDMKNWGFQYLSLLQNLVLGTQGKRGLNKNREMCAHANAWTLDKEKSR